MRRAFSLALAEFLIRHRQFNAAHALLVRQANRGLTGLSRCRVYAGLAETEFQRCHFLNARFYANLCLEAIDEEFSDPQPPRVEALLEKARWYYSNSKLAADEQRKVKQQALRR